MTEIINEKLWRDYATDRIRHRHTSLDEFALSYLPPNWCFVDNGDGTHSPRKLSEEEINALQTEFTA